MKQAVAIFDMDGTLLDSMYYWRQAPKAALYRLGYMPDDEDDVTMRKLGYYRAPSYAIEKYHLSCTREAYFELMDQEVLRHYREDVLLKPNALPYLRQLRDKGVRLVVLTASANAFIELMLDKFDMAHLFEKTYSARDMKLEKSSPAIYDIVFHDLNCTAADCTLFEDSAYSVKNAAALGMRSVGILDANQIEQHDALRETCYRTVERYAELLAQDVF